MKQCLLCLLVGLILCGANAARAGSTAWLHFDFAAKTLRVATEGAEQVYEIDDARERLESFREALSKGLFDENESAELGRLLLGAAAAQLSSAERWIVSPIEAAPLSALKGPWNPHQALIATKEIGYLPPSVNEFQSGDDRAGVLAITPYTGGLSVERDSSDDIYNALRRAERSVELIPRNDSRPDIIGVNLQEQDYALLWLRASPSTAADLLPSMAASNAPLLWTQPQYLESHDSAQSLQLAARFAKTHACVIVDLWPHSEERMATSLKEFFTRCEDADALTALTALRRTLANEASEEDWAGIILIGDPGARWELKKPGWLQGWLRRR